jgi:hypothetical protein
MKCLVYLILLLVSNPLVGQVRIPKKILNQFPCASIEVLWYEFQPVRSNSCFERSVLIVRIVDENVLYIIDNDSCRVEPIPNSKKHVWYIVRANNEFIQIRTTNQKYQYTYNCALRTFGRMEKIKKFPYKWDLDTEH